MLFTRAKTNMVAPEEALPGRDAPIPTSERHFVLGTPLKPPSPRDCRPPCSAWAASGAPSALFWEAPGVYTTAVGYAGGYTPNPTYEEVCSGRTGHTEAVLVVFDPAKTSYEEILRHLLGGPRPDPGHAPGQRRRHASTAPRSTTPTTPSARPPRPRETLFAERLSGAGYGEISTEVAAAGPFYYAEDYHQQYLAKNPNGYCGLGGTGVSCPVGIGATEK